MSETDRRLQPALLVLEDDGDVCRLLVTALSAAGFQVATAESVASALQRIEAEGLPDLAIVDLRLEGESGLDFCRRVHEFSDLPIVVLTSVAGAREAAAAIHRYAEDYVRKPFDVEELLARVQRILRRVGTVPAGASGRLQLAPDLSVDLVRQRAWRGSDEVGLTPTECRLLHVLARNLGRTVETAALLRRLWPDQEVFEDTLRVHIHRLRRKLQPALAAGGQPLLVTERGLGYRLEKAN